MMNRKFILSKNIDRSLAEHRQITKNLDLNYNDYIAITLQDTPSCIDTQRSRNISDKYEITHHEFPGNTTSTRLLTAINRSMACIIQTYQLGNMAAAGILSEIRLRVGPPGGEIYLANVYIRPQAGYCDVMRLLSQLVDKSRGRTSKLLIIGDVNASSTLWDPDHDIRSEEYQ